jgi:hypothetical protein
MAMSHENCNHPRTPAGRAACRKAGGPGATPAAIPTVISSARQAARVKQATLPRQVAVKSARSAAATGARIADLPKVFTTAYEWGVTNDCASYVWEIRGQRMLDIVNANGTLTLTWSKATPLGVHAVSWRPAGTSITTKLGTVNEGLEQLRG